MYEKSQRGKKCIFSIHFQSAKLGRVLHHNRFLMFGIFGLVENLPKGSSCSIWSFAEQVQIMPLECHFFKILDERFQFVWKTSKHGQLTLQAKVQNRVYKNRQVILKFLFWSWTLR